MSPTWLYLYTDNWVTIWCTVVNNARSVQALTLPTLQLLLLRAQGPKDLCKPSKPCLVGIHWIALTEYSQMSTHVPGFQSLFSLFLHRLVSVKLAISSIRVKSRNYMFGTERVANLFPLYQPPHNRSRSHYLSPGPCFRSVVWPPGSLPPWSATHSSGPPHTPRQDRSPPNQTALTYHSGDPHILVLDLVMSKRYGC